MDTTKTLTVAELCKFNDLPVVQAEKALENLSQCCRLAWRW